MTVSLIGEGHATGRNSEARGKQGGVSWFLSSQRTPSNRACTPSCLHSSEAHTLHDDEGHISKGSLTATRPPLPSE